MLAPTFHDGCAESWSNYPNIRDRGDRYRGHLLPPCRNQRVGLADYDAAGSTQASGRSTPGEASDVCNTRPTSESPAAAAFYPDLTRLITREATGCLARRQT